MWRRMVIGFTFFAASCMPVESVLALASFKKVFDEQYIKQSDDEDFKKAFKKLGCNTCHVKKKKRHYVNAYGLKLSEAMAGNAKDRLDAAMENGGLEAKRAENARLLRELEIALRKVENMKASAGGTYGELFQSHQLPVKDGGKSIRPEASGTE